MIELLGRKFINEKEACQRYDYSPGWFRKQRFNKKEPKFVKSAGTGKIYYPVDETDKWFKDKMEMQI